MQKVNIRIIGYILVFLFAFSLGAKKEAFASTEETIADYDGSQYKQIVLDIENALQENGTCQAFLLNI